MKYCECSFINCSCWSYYCFCNCMCIVHVGATWRRWLNHPCSAAMRPFCQITSMTVCYYKKFICCEKVHCCSCLSADQVRPSFLLPYFCIQLFDFFVSCLAVIGCFTHEYNVRIFFVMQVSYLLLPQASQQISELITLIVNLCLCGHKKYTIDVTCNSFCCCGVIRCLWA